MAQVLITSDIHIHPHRNEQRRVEDGLQCLRWIYDTAKLRGLKDVIVAGDFLHDRYRLPTYAYSKACKMVAEYRDQCGIDTVFLLGNHDMFYENEWSVHSLAPIREWATVIDAPQQYESKRYALDFLPYTPKPSEHLPFFKKPNKTLISHLSVSDAILNAKFDIISVEDDSKEKEIIGTDAFTQWKKVWLGHYHYGQKVSNIVEYVGSPMQLTFGEAGQTKHIAIFDTETLKTEYIENTISPKFHIIDDDPERILRMDVANAYIEVRTAAQITSKFELAKKLEKSGARQIEFKPPKVDIAAKTTKAIVNISSYFNDKPKLVESYVDGVKVPEGLNISLLKKIGKEIVS